MQRPTPRRKKPAVKKPLPTWALVWIALTLVVLVIFMANKSTIDQVLETTGFVKAVQGDPVPEEILEPVEIKANLKEPELPLTDVANDDLIKTLKPETVVPPVQEPMVTEVTSPEPKDAVLPTKPFKAYFITVNGDGQIDLTSVVRKLPQSASPLTEVIKTLLLGPNPEELSKGYLSLIPTSTRLLSIKIQNNTAVLSFSDDFQFNTLGMEGYTAQLKQIVYTATEFPTVKQVQILIDGKQREYLGSEAVPIGMPLTRGSFGR